MLTHEHGVNLAWAQFLCQHFYACSNLCRKTSLMWITLKNDKCYGNKDTPSQQFCHLDNHSRKQLSQGSEPHFTEGSILLSISSSLSSWIHKLGPSDKWQNTCYLFLKSILRNCHYPSQVFITIHFKMQKWGLLQLNLHHLKIFEKERISNMKMDKEEIKFTMLPRKRSDISEIVLLFLSHQIYLPHFPQIL